MEATVGMVGGTGTGVTTTLEPSTTTMLVPTLTLLLTYLCSHISV